MCNIGVSIDKDLNATQTYGYDPEKHEMCLPEKEHRLPEPFNTFAVLHEQGHAYNRHEIVSYFLTDTVVKQEKEAWEYAKECIKPQWHKLFDVYARASVATYENMFDQFGMIIAQAVLKGIVRNYRRS